jgi:hypothetical protein
LHDLKGTEEEASNNDKEHDKYQEVVKNRGGVYILILAVGTRESFSA